MAIIDIYDTKVDIEFGWCRNIFEIRVGRQIHKCTGSA